MEFPSYFARGILQDIVGVWYTPVKKHGEAIGNYRVHLELNKMRGSSEIGLEEKRFLWEHTVFEADAAFPLLPLALRPGAVDRTLRLHSLD